MSTPPPRTEAQQRAAERVALMVAIPPAFLTPFMGSSANIALPSISVDLGLPAVELTWVSTAYLLAAAALLLPFGRIADIVGRKRIFAWGLVVYAFSSVLCALAPNGALLIGARILQGVGGAMTFATNVAILTSVFAPERRGAALGTSVASTYLGMSLGPVLGGMITQSLGWRAVFGLGALIALVALLVLAWKLRGEWADARGESFDLFGSALFVVSLSVTMYGVSLLPLTTGVVLVVAGLLGVACFGFWELHTPNPALNMELILRNRTFALSNVAALINYAATATVSFFLSIYLQAMRGLSPDAAGLVLVAQPVFQAIFSPIMGRLSDRIEPRILASLGMALCASGLGLLGFVGRDTPLGYIIGTLVLLGFGFALFSSPNTNAVMGSVERRLYGIASATLGTMRLVGNMLSMGVAVLLIAVLMGNVPVTPEYFDAFLRCLRTGFPLFTGLCILGVWASLARGKRRRRADA